MKDTPGLIQNDPWLEPYRMTITRRMKRTEIREHELVGDASLQSFASGHLWFGHAQAGRGLDHEGMGSQRHRDFPPGNVQRLATGRVYRFKPLDHGNWEIRLDEDAIVHGDRYLIRVRWEGGEGKRIPAWCTRVVQNPETKVFDAQVLESGTNLMCGKIHCPI